jgi:SAM-dependent methyltransferase
MRYELKPIEARCPVCGFKDGLLLYSVNNYQSAQHFILKEKHEETHTRLADHIKQLWGSSNCSVIRCKNCLFCYAEPYVGGDAMFYYYAYKYSNYRSIWKWEHQITYDIIKNMKDDGKLDNFKLFDIGAGDGIFIKQIASHLTDAKNIICTEYSDYCVSKINQMGVKCLKTDVCLIQDKTFYNYFDIICLFQVLQGLDNNEKLFEQLSRITRKNASIFISVPNPDWIEFNELSGALLDMPPYHIGRWNEQSFRTICERYGWRLVSYNYEPPIWKEKITSYALQRWRRKKRTEKSLENYIAQIKNKYIEKFLSGLAILTDMIIASPKYYQLLTKQKGKAALVHIQT